MYKLHALTLWPEWIPTFTASDLEAHSGGRAQKAEPSEPDPRLIRTPATLQEQLQPKPKDVENRDWESPPFFLIGRWMAWHAGGKVGGGRGGKKAIPAALEIVNQTAANAGWPSLQIDPERLIYSAIVALVKIDAVIQNGLIYTTGPTGQQVEEQLEPSRWAFSNAWQLRIQTYRPITPIPCSGFQRLWTVKPEHQAAIREQAAARPEWKW